MALELTVQAGEHPRKQAPVSVTLPASAVEGSVRVVDEITGVSIPAQAAKDGDQATLIFLVEGLDAHETRVYRLEAGPTPDQVVLTDDGNAISVALNGEPFTAYLYSKDHYRPHFYPVFGPQGKEVTETGAADHKHHRSLYVAYGEVNGVDCWAEGSHSGRVQVSSLKEVTSGPVFGNIIAESVWLSKDETRLMTDTVTWRIYNLPQTRRIVDATVVFHASEGDVHFGDTKEGGILSVRVAPTVKVSNTGKIENSFGGINEAETWGKRANWCDYSGYVDGVHLGIAIFDGIANPRHPCHWHVRNYGLMTTNIFGRGTFETGRKLLDGDGQYVLKAGDSLTFRYQVVVHAGDAGDADLAGAYHQFVNPPKVAVKG